MTIRRQRREDPAYLTAMREAKELFDAEMAKNSMKGRGRPKNVVVAAPTVAAEVEIDHEVADEIANLAPDESEAEAETEEDGDVAEAKEVAPPRAAKQPVKPLARAAAKSPAKPAAKAVKAAGKSSVRSARKAPARGARKPAAKGKAAPTKKAAAKRR